LADRTIGRAFGTLCRLSVVCLSVTFCIVAKPYVLAKNCLKEWIGNQGQRVDFLGCRHISTSGFAATATKTAVFALFLPVTAQQSVLDGTNGLSGSNPCAYCRIVWSELKPEVVLAMIMTQKGVNSLAKWYVLAENCQTAQCYCSGTYPPEM